MGKFLKRLRAIRSQVEQIRTAANNFNPDSELVGFQDFKNAWVIIKPASELVKTLTPDRVDSFIDKLLAAGDEVANGGDESEFVKYFSEAWTYIRTALFVAMKFTSDKADGVIEEIIEWGDYIAEK